ncbi:MAG: PmoA family protein [Planctomycetales bacterium]|nr:PmoA family protein [Planctomycetales bacterium]
MLSRIQIFLLSSVLLSASSLAVEQGMQCRQDENGVLVSEDGAKVLYYQRSDRSKDGNYTRAHYVHPLYDLDGNVLTEDFPDDHRHHRGVFWAWHQLIVADQSVGDGWALHDLRWDVRSVIPTSNDDGSVTLDMTVDWKSSLWRGGRQAIVEEKSSIRIYPRQADRRRIDFQIHMRSTNPETRIGGSDDDKGYGGFSVRIRLPDDIRFLSQNGYQTPTKTIVAASSWMSMTGKLGDGPSDQTRVSGLTVLCHPDSAGYPQPWILRSKNSMQNPVWPGRTPQLIPTDNPITLRYRVVIHRDPVAADLIQQWQNDYAESE